MLAEQIGVTLAVVEALENLGVRYVIGGSFSSAVHGVMRATMDVDLVADIHMEHVEPFVEALGDDFYVDIGMIRDAIRQFSSFNLIHLGTMFKVDIFVAKQRPFDQSQLDRRKMHLLVEGQDHRAYFASAEDTVLAKLEWYRLGGEISDRQWNDVVGVLKVQVDRLDHDYLSKMAVVLSVEDILAKALDQAR